MSGTAESRTVIPFGPFEADLTSQELRKHGVRLRLPRQSFQILKMLLDRPGQLVSRDEMRAALWPSDTFVDFEHSLNAAINKLREALGDDADDPCYIETLHRRGYRFLIPLQGQADTLSPAVPAPSVGAVKRRPLMIGGSVLLLLAGVVVGWFVAHRVSLKVEPSEQRLTANSMDIPVHWAALSPDGKYLAYRDRTGYFLRLVSTGETHALNLPSDFMVRPTNRTSDSKSMQVAYAGWFPDSSNLLVTHYVQTEERESVWSVSPLGGNPKKLTEDGEGRAVSSDGSQVAFVRGLELPQSLWVMDVDGSHARKLVGQTGDTFGPAAWSPDNHKLAFIRFMFQAGNTQANAALGIYDFESGATSYLLKDPRLEPSLAWTQDNRLIYSLREPPPKWRESNLWVVHVDGRTGTVRGPAKRLTDSPDRKVLVSVSDNGKALTYLRLSTQLHIYVATVPRGGGSGAIPNRMKLDEGNNSAFTWTPDGESVIFISDRDGRPHLYKQGIRQPAPDLLVGGNSSVRIARMSPDRSEILYSTRQVTGKQGRLTTILAIPVNGGSPREVLRADGIDDFQCARAPANVCVISQPNGETSLYSTFDPKTGVVKPSLTIPGGDFPDSLSPDGTTLAVAPDRSRRIPAEIQLHNLRDSSWTTLEVKGRGTVYSIDWNPDGKSLWVGAPTSEDVAGVVRVDLQGNVTPLIEDAETTVCCGIPSPDGSHVAYWRWDASSNVWLLRGF